MSQNQCRFRIETAISLLAKLNPVAACLPMRQVAFQGCQRLLMRQVDASLTTTFRDRGPTDNLLLDVLYMAAIIKWTCLEQLSW